MPSFKQYSGLKYASFSVWWICDRQLTHLMEKRNNPCWIFSFSYPSAPLTHKYALRTFPQLYSLPLEWQKNRGAAVPTNIRMQTTSTGLAAILHLKAPWYSLLSWQIKKKWYRAIWCPFNAISRFKWHFTFNTSLKYWLHPAVADDTTFTVFPLQSSLRLGGKLGQALSWQPADRASSQHSFWS